MPAGKRGAHMSQVSGSAANQEWGSELTTEWELDGQPGLVLVHMQNGIIDPIPSIRESPMIDNQRRLVAAFRERDLPVFFSCAIPNPFGKLPAYGRLMQLIREGITETPMLE